MSDTFDDMETINESLWEIKQQIERITTILEKMLKLFVYVVRRSLS